MDLKLQRILYALPTRTAWIVIGSCVAFWLVCLTGILTPPVSTPPHFTLFWFYTMLMLVLASGIAVIACTAVVVLKRGGRTLPVPPAPESGPPRTAPPAPGQTEPDGTGPDQLAGLNRMLDNPDNRPDTGTAKVSRREPEPAPRATAGKPRKRRR